MYSINWWRWNDVMSIVFRFYKSCKISHYIFFKFINFLLFFLISFIPYYIFRIVNSLPKTSTGKVQKNVLREMSKEFILWPHDVPVINPSMWRFDKIQFFANYLHEHRVSKFKIFQIIRVDTNLVLKFSSKICIR